MTQPTPAEHQEPPPLYLNDLGVPPTRPRRSRRPLVVAGAAAGAVMLVVLGGLAVYDILREDPGIAACKSMAENQTGGSSADGEDEDLTEEEYRTLRDQFADSDHEKIREHGTALVDVVWEVSKLDDEESLGILAYMQPLTTHAMGLKTACADEGIFVDLDMG